MALIDTMNQIQGIAKERTMAGPSDRLPMGADKKQRYRQAFMELDQKFKQNREQDRAMKERNRVAAQAMLQYEAQKKQAPQGQSTQNQAPQRQMQPQQNRQIKPLLG